MLPSRRWAEAYLGPCQISMVERFVRKYLTAANLKISEAVTGNVLKNFAIFTGIHLRPATLLKRDSNTSVCIPVNVAKYLRTSLL